MRVKQIKIQNYKGIVEADIEFNDQVNVFIGSNGAGKTTLLEAIVVSLTELTSGLIGNFFKLKLSNDDINYRKNFASILCDLEVHDFREVTAHSKKTKKQIPLFSKIGLLPISDIEKEYNLEVSRFNLGLKEQFSTTKFDLPILKFYPADRGAVRYITPNTHSVYLSSQLEAWANLRHHDLSYSKFFKWFFDNETQELRMQRDAQDFTIENPKIKYVRKAVEKAFKYLDGVEYIVTSNEIEKHGTNRLIPTLSIQRKDKKITENLDSKSDGEKAIITLVADIAYNLSIAKYFTKDDDYLASLGIVLIDEIEAHLHPNWQRKIVPLLMDLFPNIQFFITTHSPQIIASVNSDSVFICEDFKFSKLAIKSKGLDSNALLKYVFNATDRPKNYVDLLQEFDTAIEESKSLQEIEAIITKITKLEQEDTGTDVSQLISDLTLQLEAYKFELEHEVN